MRLCKEPIFSSQLLWSRWGLWKKRLSFLAELGHRITALSGDSRMINFLFQRVSVLVQRFNSVLLRESFTADSRPDDDL